MDAGRLNAGALVAGGVVWKMYFENLKATIGTKDAELSLASKQVDYWREKAEELEKRSPEAVERVLADRISIREDEIARLTNDKESGSEELKRVAEEVKLLHRDLDQTKGFRAVLAMEQTDPDDPEYQEYLEYLAGREDRVVKMEVVFLGAVGGRTYRDTQTGATVTKGEDFLDYDQPLKQFGGETPKALIVTGRLTQLPGYGELLHSDSGQAGAGVVFQSGWGDGYYPVYGEKHDGRIVRVYVNCGADPVGLVQPEPGASTPAPLA